MSKEIKKNKFMCLVNCLSVKSRSAKRRKDGNRVDDYGPLNHIRMEHTRRWLHSQSLDANDGDFAIASDSLDDSKEGVKKISKTHSSEKHNSLSDFVSKSEIDFSDDRTPTKLETMAQVRAPLPPVPNVCIHHSRRGMQGIPDADNVDEASINSSCISLMAEKVFIRNDSGEGIGIAIVGHSSGTEGDCGIFVGRVKKGGPADATGRVEPGDLILEVNGINLENMKNDEAIAITRREMSRPGTLTLVLAKYWDINDYSSSATNTPIVQRVVAGGRARHYPNDDIRRRIDETFTVRSSRIGGEIPLGSFSYRQPNVIGPPMGYYVPAGHVPYPNMMVYAPVMPVHMNMNPHDSGILSPTERSDGEGPFTGSQIISWIQKMPGMAALNVAREYAQRLFDTGYITGTERKFHDGGLYMLRLE